jgi:small subunit ribosomal protein S20
MANHKSSKKSIRKTLKRTLVNKMLVSKLRTSVKKLQSFIDSNDKKSAVSFFPEIQSELMKNVTKGNMKKNAASRKISRLAAQLKKLS